MADEARETGPRRSVRGSEQRTTSKAEAFRPSSSRPTAAEREQAERRIEDMKAAPVEPPILSSRGRPPRANIVACAIAFQRGEVFDSDEEAFRQFGVPERYEVRRIWVNDKLARLAAYEQAQWQDRAVRAEAAYQDPRCANDAERDEEVADWKRSFDMPFEDGGTDSCVCKGYITWCACRKTEHPACRMLEFMWDDAAQQSPGIPRGSRPYFAKRARDFEERGIRLSPSAEAFLLHHEWLKELSPDERAQWADQDVPADVYEARQHSRSFTFPTSIRLHMFILDKANPTVRKLHDEAMRSMPAGESPSSAQLYQWFRDHQGWS